MVREEEREDASGGGGGRVLSWTEGRAEAAPPPTIRVRTMPAAIKHAVGWRVLILAGLRPRPVDPWTAAAAPEKTRPEYRRVCDICHCSWTHSTARCVFCTLVHCTHCAQLTDDISFRPIVLIHFFYSSVCKKEGLKRRDIFKDCDASNPERNLIFNATALSASISKLFLTNKYENLSNLLMSW